MCNKCNLDDVIMFGGWLLTLRCFKKLCRLSKERFGDTKKEHLLELLQEGAV